MSCLLRVLGEDFNVDRFVEETQIADFRKRYKGDFVSPSRDKRLEHSSASIIISDADFSNIKTQIEEAEAFLVKHKSNLRNIATTKEIEYATIDFGADSLLPNGMTKSFYFPISLVSICAELKIGIELSVYAV